MSGHDLIDDYLSELMDDPRKGDPAQRKPERASHPAARQPASVASEPAPTEHDSDKPATAPAPSDDPLAAFREGAPTISDDEFENMLDALQGQGRASEDPPPNSTSKADEDPLAAFREGGEDISDDEFEAMLDALEGSPPNAGQADRSNEAAPTGDPLAAFREGGDDIGEDEFEAMLDALGGAPPAATKPEAGAPAGDPLAAFRQGSEEIGEDEFEAMLDALQSPAAASPSTSAAVPGAAAPAPSQAASLPAPSAAIQAMLPPSEPSPAHGEPAPPPDQRRRAEDRITSWLRFNLARQCFAVEVLKVQEVLRVPHILPVRGTGEATLGVMNLRGQIVPVMDLAIRLGFSPTEPNEASRVIVLEENGETLGLLVASVADVLNLSDSRMERISGTPSLVAADVLRGISRRDGQIVIMLDASKLLA